MPSGRLLRGVAAGSARGGVGAGAGGGREGAAPSDDLDRRSAERSRGAAWKLPLPPLLIGHQGPILGSLFVVHVLLALQVTFSAREDWLGWMPATVASWTSVTVLGCPLSAMVAAWAAGQQRQRVLHDWVAVAPRPPRSVPTQMVLQIGGATVIVWIVALALMIASGMARGGTLTNSVTTGVPAVTATLAYGVTWTTVGVLLGRSVMPLAAIPLAGAGAYGWIALSGVTLSSGPLLSLAIPSGLNWMELRPSAAFLWIVAALWVFAGLGALFLARGQRRAGVVSAWSVSLALALSIFTGNGLSPIPGARRTECRGTQPVVCLSAPFATILPAYQRLSSKLVSSLPSALRPQVVAADKASVPRSALSRSVLYAAPVDGDAEPSLTLDDRQYVGHFGDILFLSPCSNASPQQHRAALSLDWWWWRSHDLLPQRARRSSPLSASADPSFRRVKASAARLARLTGAERTAFFENHATAVRQCSLEPGQLP